MARGRGGPGLGGGAQSRGNEDIGNSVNNKNKGKKRNGTCHLTRKLGQLCLTLGVI